MRTARILLGILTTSVLIIASFVAWRYVDNTVDGIRRDLYEREISRVTEEVRDRVDFVSDMLYNLRGIASIGEIDSQKWNDYLVSTGIEDRNPEYFTFAFIDVVNNEDIGEYVKSVKLAEKNNPRYKDFFVFPKSENAQIYPIRFLHTHDSDISMLLGYDVGSSKAITQTIIESVRTGGVAMSEPTYIKLLIPASDKTGYVMSLPVYSDIRALEYKGEERNKYLRNFTGVWIEQKKLFGNLASIDETGNPIIRYDVYDGELAIWKNGGGITEKHYERELSLLNKKFRIVFSGPEGYRLSFFQENLPTLTLLLSLVIIVMWYGTLISILNSRRSAVAIADTATKDLRKFKQAVEGVSDHVIITNPEGTIIYANNAASKITGYSIGEMVGAKPSLWGKQMPADFYKNMWKTIKTDKKPFYGELSNRRKNGEIYEAEINISPIVSERGELVYFVGIERDITKLKIIDKMKSEFLSLASHQLRTPLSAVKWFGQMLLAGDAGKLSRLQREYVSKINLSNEREIQLVNSLLNISRIESGRIMVIPKPTIIKDLVDSVVTDAGVSQGDRVRNIEVRVAKNISEMNVDPELVRHVFMNLLVNAMRYTEKNGKIEVEVKTKGKFLFCSVRDNGIGIPEQEKGRIFERFFRATNAMKRETEGSGLGLYLAKTIVESSEGKIWFESKEGKGTSFFFTLPLSGMKAKKGEVALT